MGIDLLATLSAIDIWHWWIAAIALGGLELLVPGVLFLWLAVAAVIVGFVKLAMPELEWEAQLILFGVLSIVCAIIGRQVYKRMPNDRNDHPSLNQRSAQYIGRILTLRENVSNNTSRALVDDTTWAVRCNQNLAKGAKVEVIDVDGIMLIVTAFHEPEEKDNDQDVESN